MIVTAGCNHRHTVTVRLDDGETWLLESRYKGAKPVLVTTVTAQWLCDERRVSSVNLSGWYAKADGTAGKVRLGYPERTTMDALPESVRLAIQDALAGIDHG